MKEAAGEANMTVITIVLIAIVLAVGTLIVTGLMNGSGRSSACTAAGGTWKGNKCCKDSECSGTYTCLKYSNTTSGHNAGEWYCK